MRVLNLLVVAPSTSGWSCFGVAVEILTVLFFVKCHGTTCHHVVLLQTYNCSSVMHHVTEGMCVFSCERGVCAPQMVCGVNVDGKPCG